MPAQNLKRLNTKMFLPKNQKKNVRILLSGKRAGRGCWTCMPEDIGQVCSLTKVHIYYLSRFQIICIGRLKCRIFCRRLNTDSSLLEVRVTNFCSRNLIFRCSVTLLAYYTQHLVCWIQEFLFLNQSTDSIKIVCSLG